MLDELTIAPFRRFVNQTSTELFSTKISIISFIFAFLRLIGLITKAQKGKMSIIVDTTILLVLNIRYPNDRDACVPLKYLKEKIQ